MGYDVFLSYASQDRPWAARLAADLEQRGVACFYDQNSLRDGQGWEGQIRSAVLSSKHLVCLWSKAAKESAWVGRELATFDVKRMARADAAELLIKLRLDEAQSAYSSLQQIRDDSLLAAYAQNQPAPDAAWSAVIKRLKKVVKQDPNLLTVPLALLTLRETDVPTIVASELKNIGDKLELNAEALAARYGPTHGDWKPFVDSPKSMLDLLDEIKVELDRRLEPRSIDFDLTGDDFWADDNRADAWVKAMRQRMIGAVVIDPVALSSAPVLHRLQLFTQVVNMDNVMIIALPPQRASDRATKFRAWIRKSASSLVESYFDPPAAADSVYGVRCGIGLDDAEEMVRLLKGSVVQLLRRPMAPATPASPIVGV